MLSESAYAFLQEKRVSRRLCFRFWCCCLSSGGGWVFLPSFCSRLGLIRVGCLLLHRPCAVCGQVAELLVPIKDRLTIEEFRKKHAKEFEDIFGSLLSCVFLLLLLLV